jgi:hypothetical protein
MSLAKWRGHNQGKQAEIKKVGGIISTFSMGLAL